MAQLSVVLLLLLTCASLINARAQTSPKTVSPAPATTTTATLFANEARELVASYQKAPSLLEKVTEQLADIAQRLKELSRANARQIAALRESNTKNSVETISVLKTLHRCPLPWRLYRGICLLFCLKPKTWPDANAFCRARGGHLAWIADRSEHDIVRLFVKEEAPKTVWFWMGLHRISNKSPLQWTGGITSPYRGSRMQYRHLRHFKANAGASLFGGEYDGATDDFLCRRV